MAKEEVIVGAVVAALKLASAGRVGEAIRALEGGANGVLGHPAGRNVLGTLYFQTGQVRDALQSFDAAIRLAPSFADAHCNRGVALQKLGRLSDALSAYDATLRHAPDHATAHLNRGNVLKLLGRLDEAVIAFDRALRVDPGRFEARLNRGHVQMARGEYTAALADFDAAVALKADGGEALAGRASALVSLMRFEDALAAADAALALQPSNAETAIVRGQILLELDRPEKALGVVDQIATGGALGAKALIVRSGALWRLGRSREAIAAGEEAVGVDPGDPQTHQSLGHFYLAMGEFARGWEEYEYRGDSFDPRQTGLEERAPRWAGEDIAGKTILVLAEQGIGDTIQFARYLVPLHERGAVVNAIVQPAVLPLMRSLRAPIKWADSVAAIGAFDTQVPLLSLPRVFGTRVETIPGRTPYLFAEEESIAVWRERMGTGGFKVGINWQGNPKYRNDRRRSVPLANFAPLAAVPGVRLVSLQAVHGLDQLAQLPAATAIETLGDKITDNPEGLSEVAALISGLDLVVTSDTAVAHLAGALGRPVWVALAYDPDWRWLRERADSLWYPTMRLFRQKTPGDWAGVFAEIADALSVMAP